MKWSPRFATGVELIDAQHQMLFRMSEDYRAALDAGQGARIFGLMIESLDEYARAHFGAEDQCMERHRCPVAQTNRDAHGRFVAAVNRARERYQAVGFDYDDALQLVDYVDYWLSNHIARIDVQLKDCIATPGTP